MPKPAQRALIDGSLITMVAKSSQSAIHPSFGRRAFIGSLQSECLVDQGVNFTLSRIDVQQERQATVRKKLEGFGGQITPLISFCHEEADENATVEPARQVAPYIEVLRETRQDFLDLTAQVAWLPAVDVQTPPARPRDPWPTTNDQLPLGYRAGWGGSHEPCHLMRIKLITPEAQPCRRFVNYSH